MIKKETLIHQLILRQQSKKTDHNKYDRVIKKALIFWSIKFLFRSLISKSIEGRYQEVFAL